MASRLLSLFLSLTLTALVLAQATQLTQPTVIFGLQPQRPPVARVNTTWSWSLLPNTFQSAPSDTLTYSVDQLPDWATFDPSTLAFKGVPSSDDIANSTVYVTATSTARHGGSVTDSFGLLVEDVPAPTIKRPIAQQLPNATTLPNGCVLHYNNAVRVPPRWSFSIGLQWDTFALASGDFAYYTAYQVGYTSLPEWITFDPKTVTFDGVAPNNGTLDVIVFGSNHWGYGDVSQTFEILVESHSFDLLQPLPALNTSLGATIDYVVPIAALTIDRVPVRASNITSVAVDLSDLPFLSFDPSTRAISGTVPASAAGVNTTWIPVTFNNTYGQSLTTNLTFSVTGAAAAEGLLTTETIPALVIQPGQAFTLDLSQYISGLASVNSVKRFTARAALPAATYSTSYAPASAGQWLSFNATSHVLTGTAPSPAPAYGNVTVTLTALETASGARENATFPIAFTAMSSNAQLADQQGNAGGLSQTGKVAIAAVFGVLGGVGLLILLFACCKRRCTSDPEDDELPIRADRDDRRTMMSDVSPYIGYVDEKDDGRPMSWGGVPGTPNLEVEAPAAKAKRLDLMRVFRKKEESHSAVAGLGIGGESEDAADSARIVVIRPEDRGTATYRPESSTSSFQVDDSSWGSGSTRSMFYSDAELTKSRSVPRQRRDFMHKPPPLDLVAEPVPAQISPSPTRAMTETSRMINSPSLGSPSFNDSRRFSNGMLSDAAIATASLHELDAGTTVRPRLIPFTSERPVIRAVSPLQAAAAPSQPVRYGNSEIDEDESHWADARFSVQSKPYVPPEGPSSATPIFYSPVPPPVSPIPEQRESMPFGGLRMVGTSAAPASPTRRQRTRTMSSGTTLQHEPQLVTVAVGRPVHFTPALNPPPTASIGSPGRHGIPKRTYMALLDMPDDAMRDRRPLPEWLHFDVRELEFWGIPRANDVGEVHIQILERRAAASSPTRRTAARTGGYDSPSNTRPGSGGNVDEEEHEQVVGRVIITIVAHRISADMGHQPTSSVQVVRF